MPHPMDDGDDMDQLGDAPADVLDAWCRHVDAAVADGVDPFNALLDADLAYRDALQLSLDRD